MKELYIWSDKVKETIDKYTLDVVLINARVATICIGEGERLIMFWKTQEKKTPEGVF